MPTAKIRALSQYGVLTDVDSFNLPPNAFSRGVNVRFKNGSVNRAEVFRRVPITLAQTGPRYLTSNLPTSGYDLLYIGYFNGRVYEVVNNVQTNVSIAGYADSTSELKYTSCHLADVFYINRGDRVPWSRRVTDGIFLTLANWNANWRCQVLRAAGGALCAFNITEGATNFPTKIRTSTFATVNTVPASWDETVPGTIATANILSEMEGPITDAQNFGEGLVVYGLNEAWAMTPTTSTDVWDYRKLPFSKGAISSNCTVEVGGVHYVFGLNDIWRHDGVSEQSIVEGKTKRYIFDNLNVAKSHRCHVAYDAKRKLIRFHYVSGDDRLGFSGAEGCNRAAVFDLTEQTWTFDDLPFVFGVAVANLSVGATWASVVGTWDTMGSTWLDLDDTLKKSLCMLGDSNTPYNLQLSLYAFDDQGAGSIVPYDVDANATKGWLLEHDGIDLDELPEVENLQGYKVADVIYPQARIETTGAQPIMFTFGVSDGYNTPVEYATAQSYDAVDNVRCDFGLGGRFLSIKATHADYRWVNLTGFDVQVYTTGAK
jgi:hypothetical protein